MTGGGLTLVEVLVVTVAVMLALRLVEVAVDVARRAFGLDRDVAREVVEAVERLRELAIDHGRAQLDELERIRDAVEGLAETAEACGGRR